MFHHDCSSFCLLPLSDVFITCASLLPDIHGADDTSIEDREVHSCLLALYPLSGVLTSYSVQEIPPSKYRVADPRTGYIHYPFEKWDLEESGNCCQTGSPQMNVSRKRSRSQSEECFRTYQLAAQGPASMHGDENRAAMRQSCLSVFSAVQKNACRVLVHVFN